MHTLSFKRGASSRGDTQCTQVLGATRALLECHCGAALAESRAQQQQRGTQASQPIWTGPLLPGQQEISSGRGRRKLWSCTLNGQAFVCPRAPLFWEGSGTEAHCSYSSLDRSATFPSFQCYWSYYKHLNSWNTQQKHCAVEDRSSVQLAVWQMEIVFLKNTRTITKTWAHL